MTDAADAPRCIKCGREVALGETVCGICNRAGMATPSATQYHGTVVVAIVLAVAGLAFAASLSLQGVGPYRAEVRAVAPAADLGHDVTYEVTNEGTRAGRAKCQLVALDTDGRALRARNTLTTQIPGGATVELTETIPGLTEEPAAVTIGCS